MKIEVKDKGRLRLPDFFIPGAAKSGTSSLYFYLREHPRIVTGRRKEPWFFSFFENPPPTPRDKKFRLRGVVSDIHEYSALYDRAAPDQLLGDASPSYLYTFDDTIRNIQNVYQSQEAWRDLKFVICLRNPVDRVWSQYWMFRHLLREPLAFEDAIDPKTIEERKKAGWNIFYDYIGFGRYSNQVNAFQDAFGPSRVKIILYDDLRQNAAQVCREIFEFLDVDASFQPRTDVVYNVSGQPKSDVLHRILFSKNPIRYVLKKLIPRRTRIHILYFLARKTLNRVHMDPQTRHALRDIYRAEIATLGTIIHRDLSAWTNT